MMSMHWFRSLTALRLAAAVMISVLALPMVFVGNADAMSGTSGVLVAFVTHPNNLATQAGASAMLMNQSGANRKTIVSVSACGNPTKQTCRYIRDVTWSPDGRYVLVSEMVIPALKLGYVTMLLYDTTTGKLSRLGTASVDSTFFPAWALDADQVAYIATTKVHGNGFSVRVDAVTPSGRRRFAWHFDSGPQGCGGANPDPASNFFGGQADISVLQWRMARHIAVFSPNCLPTGLDVVNTQTGSVGPLDPKNMNLSEARVSPSGSVAAVSGPADLWGPGPTDTIVAGRPGSTTWRQLGRGNEPVWSLDGTQLFFDRQTRTGKLRCGHGNTAFSVSQYRANLMSRTLTRSFGSHVASESIYGFGPAQPLQGGGLVFSRVTNDLHCASMEYKLEGAGVSIQKFTSGEGIVTLANAAGLPVVQP